MAIKYWQYTSMSSNGKDSDGSDDTEDEFSSPLKKKKEV